jgi:hypothetical protein
VPEPRELPLIAECRLDLDGLRRQRDRYRALGRHVVATERRPRRLTVRFGAALDVDLLGETVDVERGCCPFFRLEPDAARRRLVVSVSSDEQDPALDAISDALGAGAPHTRR